MPISKNGNFVYSRKEMKFIRRKVSNLLTKYVNTPVEDIKKVKDEILNLINNELKIEIKEDQIFVMEISKRNEDDKSFPKRMLCSMSAYPFGIKFEVVPRIKKEKKNESKGKIQKGKT